MKYIQTHLSRLTKLALLFLFTLSIPIHSYAEDRDVSFSWTANSEPSLLGYNLYYKEGTGSVQDYNGTGLINETGQIDNSPIQIDNADAVTYTVTGLSPDKTYQFVLTAYNSEQQSDYSAIAIVYSNPSPEILGITTK